MRGMQSVESVKLARSLTKSISIRRQQSQQQQRREVSLDRGGADRFLPFRQSATERGRRPAVTRRRGCWRLRGCRGRSTVVESVTVCLCGTREEIGVYGRAESTEAQKVDNNTWQQTSTEVLL